MFDGKERGRKRKREKSTSRSLGWDYFRARVRIDSGPLRIASIPLRS